MDFTQCPSMPRRVSDITGKTFNNWTAIRYIGIGIRGQAIWEFRCKCGNTREMYSYVIKGGGIKSCGCIRGKDISGRRFGKLVAIENTGRQLPCKKTYFWRCRCDCGNEVDVWASNLLNGHTKSCGCLIKETLLIRNTRHGMSGTREYRRMSAKKHKDKYRGIDSYWNFSMEREIKRYFGCCVVCGSVDDLQIDHVFPKSRGYGLRPGNAVVLCRIHNSMGFKGDKMPEELPEYARDRILSAASAFEDHWSKSQDGKNDKQS